MKKKLCALLLGIVVTVVTVVTFGVPATVSAETLNGHSSPFAAAAGPVSAQDPSPPPGPVLDPTEGERADQQNNKNKLIAGGAAVVLLLLVFWGRSIRKKRRK